MEFSSRRIWAVCERIGPGFWDEPLNAITNGAFLVAALVAFLQWRRRPTPDWPVLALIVNVAAIGVGSFLFHTYATRWALTLDVVPIQVFIAGCLLLAMRRFLGLPWLLLPVAGLAMWGAALVWRDGIPPWWGWRWRSYGTALMLLGLVTLVVAARGFLPAWGPGQTGAAARRTALRLAGVGAVFTLSLVLATNDRAWCEAFTVAGHRFGTHPFWHLLNALTCFLLLRAMLAAGPARTGVRPDPSLAVPAAAR